MAYGVLYTYEFSEYPSVELGLSPWLFRVSFLRDGYTDEPIVLQPNDKPGLIEIEGLSESIFSPIVAQKYTFNLLCQDYWEAQSFYVKSDRELQVLIEVDKSAPATGSNYETLRRGWVLPSDTKEDYYPKPYPVEISAACGLATLKDRPLISELGKRLQKQISLAHALQTALYHTDLTIDMVTAVNLFEGADVAVGQTSGGLVIPTKDPLWQTLVPVEIFLTSENEVVSCYDALAIVLKSMRCRITQHLGIWWVVAIPEITGADPWTAPDSPTVRTRWYDNAIPGPPPNDAKNQAVNLNVTADFSGNLQVIEGSELYLQAIKSGIRIEQSFGRYVGLIPNGDFSLVDGTGLPIGWSVNNLQVSERFRAGTGTEADPYRLTIQYGGDQFFVNSTPYVAIGIPYTTASREYTRFMKRTFKCRARLVNAGSAKVAFVANRDDGPYLLTGGDWVRMDKVKKAQAVAVTVSNVAIVNNRQTTKPGWFDVSVDLGTIDRVLTLGIYLCQAEAINHYDGAGNVTGPEQGPPTPYVEYADLRLEVEQEGLNLDGVQRTIVRPGKTVKDTSLSLVIGDVPDLAHPVDRIGTFFKRANYPNLVPTTRWYKPDQIILSNGTVAGGVDGRPMIDIIAEDYARQFMFPVPTFEGELTGRMEYGPLSVLHISDLPDLGGAILTRWSWTIQDAHFELTAQKLMLDMPDEDIPASKHQWQTPDGLVDVISDQDGSPLEPVENHPYVHPDFQLLKDLIKAGVLPVKGGVRPVIPGFTPLTPGDPQGGVYPIVGGIKRTLIPALVRKKVDLPFIPG